MNRFIALLSFCILTTLNVNAQTKLFNSGDKVVVQISNTYGKVYVHEMSAQQTVYTLAKTFDQRMTDVQSVNPGINFNAMKVGQKIRVPFLAASIVKNPSDVIKGGNYVSVYYKVRPKDNLYRIANVYFDTSIENLMAINKTSTFDLKADQLIKVGWMPLGNTPLIKQADYAVSPKKVIASNPSIVETTGTQPSKPIIQTSSHQATTTERPRRVKAKKQGFFAKVFGSKNKKKTRVAREEKKIKDVVQLSEQLEQQETVPSKSQINKATPPPTVNQMPEDKLVYDSKVEVPSNDLEPSEVQDAPTYHYKSEKGIAIWNQTSSNSKNMFVLHPTAVVGSFIEITNPMMNKTVQAKVIGNIPPRTYTDDVSIVVSPRVAKMLGVVDRRFAVTVKYRE